MAWSEAARQAAAEARRKNRGGSLLHPGHGLGGRVERLTLKLRQKSKAQLLRSAIRSGHPNPHGLSKAQLVSDLANARS